MEPAGKRLNKISPTWPFHPSGQPASYLRTDLQQTSVMRTQFIDITIPGNTNLGGYDTQVIPDQVHDRGMLRRFLGIIKDTSPGIGQRSVDRTFHGIRIDETIPRPHEYLRREYTKRSRIQSLYIALEW